MRTYVFSGTHIHTAIYWSPRRGELLLMLRKHYEEEIKQYAYRYF